MEYCKIPFKQRWSDIENDLTKMMKNSLEGKSQPSLECEEPMRLYTTIYDMCIQKPPHEYSQQLYDKFCKVIEDYTKQTVLPSLREKNDEEMLRELVLRWSNHKVMVRWLSHFFNYLDRYFVSRKFLPTLKEAGFRCFDNLVYHEMHSKVMVVLLTQIRKEREGKEIDRALMKKVLDVFTENVISKYEEDLESFVLHDTVIYYSQMAINWIGEHACPDYLIKVEECLKMERERVSHYLHSTTEAKLIEKVQNELLVVVARRLIENENSGCQTLLRDDNMDDLSRMYRLYLKIPQGLEPIADIFKKHITAEGNVLIKLAEEDEVVISQVLIKRVTDLHDKYLALKEVFEIFCDKSVAGSSNAELLALFCDNAFD